MISLSKADILFMLTMLQLTPDLRLVLKSIEKTGGNIEEDTSDELRDMCTECLDEIGFDENYMPTEDGKKLEELIDKLFIG